MTDVLSVQFKSAGFPGAPGWTTLCFSPIVVIPDLDKVQAVHDFWTAVADTFPSVWSGSIVGPCQIQDVATGVLQGVFAVPPELAAPIVGTSGPEFGAGVAGPCISWYTAPNGVGRPARGRTFLVPAYKGVWDNDGTLNPGAVTSITTKGQALIDSATGFGVWRRPKLGAGGAFFTAIQARVSDKAAFLSSRRD